MGTGKAWAVPFRLETETELQPLSSKARMQLADARDQLRTAASELRALAADSACAAACELVAERCAKTLNRG